jgi:hypothetical protein
MSYNDISDMFAEYSKGNSKNCKHLKELFEQAVIQMVEEEAMEIAPMTIKKSKKKIQK